MNDYTYVRNLIKQHEGYSNKTYLDSKNIPTIGYGYNLIESFSKNEITKLGYNYNNVLSGKQTLSPYDIDILLDYSINRAVSDASKFVSNFDSLSAERQSVLIDMSFNLGGTRLNKFKNLKAAIENEDWEKASNEIINSKYYIDVKNRAKNNAEIMKGKSDQSQQSSDQSQTDTEYINNELNKERNVPEIDKSKLITDSDQIKTDGSSDYFVDEKNKTIYYLDEEGNPTQVTYDNNSDLLIYGDPANPNKIAFTDDKGDYQVWEKDKNGNFVQSNKIDYSQISNTAINQIGSLIIANNQNFSNIEKIAVSTSVSTIADFATYNKANSSEFQLNKDVQTNLQGAVVSFALSAYFAKNDNISDILKMNGTFVGNFADYSVNYTASVGTMNLINDKSFLENINPYNIAGAFVGNYLGHQIADNWIDTKNEAMGASIGSAVGSVVGGMALAETFAMMGALAGPLGILVGAFVGVIVGSIIGGLFGGSKPPPPSANANLEFDEDNLTYQIKSLSSANGGNAQAMKSIGESLGKQLVNIFTLPGGQLVDASSMPDINVIQKGSNRIKLNEFSGTFDDAQKFIANIVSTQMPFINVENGNEYVLRAMNRTNEKFLSGNSDDLNRVNLTELYTNISLAKDYGVYVNEPLVQDYVNKLLKDNDPIKIDEINHWKEVLNVAKELRLDEHHYSEDYNKLNSEIAKYNYQIKEQNNQLLNVDYDKYIEQIKTKMLAVYNQSASDDETSTNNLNISKDEAHNILVELGYDFTPAINQIFSKKNDFQPKIEISSSRFDELLKIANIPNPLDNFKASDDAFSFAGKTLNDLQFKLENNTLVIKTLDKDLPKDIANEKSQTFTINNWSKWDKTNSNIELPDGTKVNIQALINLIGVKDNQGFVDVNDAFKNILSKDETISTYLKNYDSKNIYIGTDSNDTIKAYGEDNLIVTGNGKNTIVTGSGNDIVFAHKGINNISTGLGNDTVSYEKSSEAVYTSLEKGGTAGIAKGDTYSGVENLKGSKYDDVLEGDIGNNTLFGGAGNDILRGGAGSDTLDGGSGVDIASYETSKAVQINLKNNYATGGEATGDKFVSIEGIKGSSNSDVIVGDDNANIIYANDGDDVVSGNGGDDVIFGGNGNDYIKGDDGADTLYGEDGNDVLIGGAGDDLLIGGNGKNTLIGDGGTDTVKYKGASKNFEIIFFDKNTVFIKSLDGKTLDTLKDIEELVFDDAVFKIDYENKTLIKKVVFESYKDEAQTIPNVKTTNNQAASIATAVAIGTVATAETKESSDVINYFDDPIKEEENKTNKNQIVILTLTKENPLYDFAQKIKEYNENSNTIIAQKTDETNNKGIYQLPTISKKNNEIAPNNEIEQTPSNIVDTQTFKELVKKTTLIETTILPQDFVEDENLPPLIAPQIILNNTTIYEDNNLFGMEILNSNSSSTLTVVFMGLPDAFSMSAGEKRADGNWYLTQNDLINLQMIPQTNNSDDFDLIVKAIVTDTHGRVIISQLTQTIEIIAVADTPNLDVENKTFGLEDTQIPLVISSSLVDTLGGPDGKESLIITIENVPLDAILSAGVRDTDGIWYLQSSELSGLKITPKLNDGNDFTVKVTAYAIESENGDIASVSENIFVEVYAIADTPTLEVKNSLGDEDTAISLDIKSNLVDDDGSEILTLTIEGVPNGAVLNKGVKDENGIWHLTKEDLKLLTITPKLNDATDFTIKVTAKTQENENGDIATISKDIFVKVNAIADNVIFDLHQNISGQDAVAVFTEDPGFAFINIKSSFIDLDGSESVHYIIEGLPLGTTLNNGTLIEEGKWKLMPSDLTDLSINLVQNSDVDFALKVTAVTTETENNHQEFTTKYIDVKIESVADFAILNVSDVKGYANSFIDLNIQSSLIDNDGSEKLEIVIEQVPLNAVLNKGTKDDNGAWHLSKDDLQGLQIRPEFNSTQAMELKVKAISTEAKNGSFEESIAYVKVNIDSLPSSSDITVHQAQAFEDTLCNLNISVDTSYLKPLETIYLELEIPNNCTLNNGEKLNDTKWKLSLNDLQGLNLKTPIDYSGSFFVNINSVIVKANGILEVSNITTKLPVDILAVADKPILEVNNISGNEDDLVYLNISSRLKDIDGSESLKVEIEGLPSGALLSVGTKVNNTWIIEQKDIESICLLMPENLSGDFSLKIKAISTEKSNDDTQEVLKEINLHLNEVIDKPILHVVDSYIKNHESNLNIVSSLRDLDGSESLKINISNLPNGATLNKGSLKSNGSYDLTIEDLNGLKILNIDNNVQLIVKSIVNDSQTNIIEKNLNITLPTQNDMYISINNLHINSDFSYKDNINTTDANDTIKAGGMGDVVHSFGGKDVIYGDTQDGFINTTFNISKDILLQNNEVVIFEISNLPQNSTSINGTINNGKLTIINEFFDGNISLSIPNQKEKIDLTVVARVVDKNDISTVIKSISLPLSIDSQEYAGNDYINAGLGNDTIYAQEGNDIVHAGDGDDTLFGAEGDDFLSGGKGQDKIDGGSGNDFIVMDFDDLSVNEFLPLIVNGGSGYDTLKIDDTRGVSFDMGITNIEKFIGGDGNDTVIGSEYSDIVIGGKGSDVFYTLGGNDTIYIDNEDIKAQAGNFVDAGSGYDKIYINDSVGVVFDVSGTNAEEIHSGTGNDTVFASSDGNILDGNDGIDTINFIHSNGGVNVNLSTGISSAGFAQGDMIINFENIVGTNFDDVLVGNNKDNIFYAKKGNDSIDGSSGYDTVVIDGSLKDFYNKDLKNIITNFNLNATVITQYGITQITNIEQITFDDYVIYLDGRSNVPVVYNDLIFTQEDTAVQINSSNLLDNDFSMAGGNLRILEVKNASNGNVSLDSNGNILFTPNANYNSSLTNTFDKNSALFKGNAGFEYVVVDERGNKSTGYTQVNVNAINDAPEVVSHYFNRNGLYTGSGRFIINDIDSDVSATSVSVVSTLEGSTNINGRNVENDGEFYFNYKGIYENYGGIVYYDMRPFTVGISDNGDILTGENKKSILYATGIYHQDIQYDPIVLDLDGDGIEIEDKYYKHFDEILTGVKGDDAVLFWDIDGDKKISSSFETDFTFLDKNASNDLDVLRTFFDSNKDGIFDNNDNKWEEFALWQDKNNDGLMSDDEYKHISNSDILKLNLEDKYSSDGKLPIDEYSTYITKNNEEKTIASSFVDTTMTPDKLILKEATVLNEQLATLNQEKNDFYETETNNNLFEDVYQEENIA